MTSPKDFVKFLMCPQLVELSLMCDLDELKVIDKEIKSLWRKYHPLENLDANCAKGEKDGS